MPADCQQLQDGLLNGLYKEAPAPAAVVEPKASRLQVLTLLLLVANALALGAGLGMSVSTYRSVARRLDAAMPFVDVIVGVAPSDNMARGAAAVLRQSAAASILGSANGSLPILAQNIMAFNYSRVAVGVQKLGQKVAAAFDGGCTPVLYNCPINGAQFVCPNTKATVTCNAAQKADCSPACFHTEVVKIARIVASVGEVVAKWAQVGGRQSGAAFGDGVLNIEDLLTFADSQESTALWAEAATVCQKFTANVDKVDWTGRYTGFDGQEHVWDVNSNVGTLSSAMKEVCDGLQGIMK
jgi:hypothetical protein